MVKPNEEARARLAELQALETWLRGAQKQFMALTTGDVLDRIRERYDEIWSEIKTRRGVARLGAAWLGAAWQGTARQGKARLALPRSIE